MKLNINISEFKKFTLKKAKKIVNDYDTVIDNSLNELGGRLLNKVIKKTPVGKSIKEKNSKGKLQIVYTGGNLRRSWYVTKIAKVENKRYITLYNTAKYARFVEYGHRQTPGRFVPAIGKKLKANWVKGRFMMTNSVAEINKIRQAIFNRNIAKALGEI